MSLEELFGQFLREKTYLQGVSKKTTGWYSWAYKAYRRFCDKIDKESLKEFVMGMSEQGYKPVTINTYIRGMNSFLTWMYENEHTTEHLRIKPVKEPRVIIQTLSEDQLKKILAFKPKDFYGHRLKTLLVTLMDTGCRIQELLDLERESIDFDNLVFKVRGKGSKDRIIPFSLELRKALFRFLQKHEHRLVFPTRDGGRWDYHNVWNQITRLGKRLGIEGVRFSAHTFRHGFAVNYIRQGGNVFTLQRLLGHTTLQMSQRYVNLDDADLRIEQARTSLLSRLK